MWVRLSPQSHWLYRSSNTHTLQYGCLSITVFFFFFFFFLRLSCFFQTRREAFGQRVKYNYFSLHHVLIVKWAHMEGIRFSQHLSARETESRQSGWKCVKINFPIRMSALPFSCLICTVWFTVLKSLRFSLSQQMQFTHVAQFVVDQFSIFLSILSSLD